MSSVRVGKRFRVAIVYGVKKRRIAIVGSILKELPIQPLDEFRGAGMAVEHSVAAKRRLKARHQQGGGNSLAADVCEGNTEARRPETDEIVVIAADGASRAANGPSCKPGNC